MLVDVEGVVLKGHLPPTEGRKIVDAIRRNEGKRVRVSVALAKKRRSLNQNSFFHGPFLDACTDMFNEAGNNLDRNEVKEMLKRKFGLKVTIKMPDGTEEQVSKSTRDYTTIEIEDLMTKIRAWAAFYTVQLPFPNEEAA